ncbi:MAG: family 43 glycosylhydrolase [Clostridia bacterium]|nr:family 43 glycosylhydrolase [Clostridia bacterium]
MLKRENIRIRDPFIYTDYANQCYYMYGTTALEPHSLDAQNTFSVYRSRDLEYFEEPKTIFDGGKIGFWADRDFWAPEVHKYNGKYYLFGSCKADGQCRATHIFVCDTPDGEFVPLTEEPITPRDWDCLDGTFWVEDGIPYIVFSHEWTQIKNGEIWAMPLSNDLRQAVGEPFLLFRASDNPEVSELDGREGTYVTDGPFLYFENGRLHMTWSSFYQGRYLVLQAESDSLRGNWTHSGSRFDFDGGHAMLFQRLDGKRMISLHRPNIADFERPFFREY